MLWSYPYHIHSFLILVIYTLLISFPTYLSPYVWLPLVSISVTTLPTPYLVISDYLLSGPHRMSSHQIHISYFHLLIYLVWYSLFHFTAVRLLSFPLPISSSRFISESYHLKVCPIPWQIFSALFFTISDWLTSALFRIYLIVVVSLSVQPTCHHMYGYLQLSISIPILPPPYLLISIPVPAGRLHNLLYQISSYQIHFVFVLSLSLSAKFK